MKTLAVYLVYWLGLVALVTLSLLVKQKQEKIRWWED